MTDFTKQKNLDLSRICDDVTTEYGEYIQAAYLHTSDPEYDELELRVVAESDDAAADIAVSGVCPTVREHPKFDTDEFRETAVSADDAGVYLVFVRAFA